MSPFMEFEGKTVERAVTSACEVLKIPRDQLKHDVISYGATGIFGLVGVKKARIRVAAPEPAATETARYAGDGPLPEEVWAKNTSLSSSVGPANANHPAEDVSVSGDSAAPGRLVLQKLVYLVAGDAEITAKSSSRQIVYTVSGCDTAALIGKRGQTLEAIEYILNKIVNKSSEHRTRIVVDIEGYVLKRRKDLYEQACRFAEKACRNGKPVIIGRFNPQDRKIIHVALKNDRRVKTCSKGEGYLKNIIVMPRSSDSETAKA